MRKPESYLEFRGCFPFVKLAVKTASCTCFSFRAFFLFLRKVTYAGDFTVSDWIVLQSFDLWVSQLTTTAALVIFYSYLK